AMANSEASGTRAAVVDGITNSPLVALDHMDFDWGLCTWDIRNNFRFNYVYELPWGHGRRWMNNNNALSQIVGGRQLSGIMTFRDGSPFTYFVQLPSTLSAMTIQYVRPVAKEGNPVGGVILGKPNETCNGTPCLR